jgi:GT2 family glycosyltransferase
MSGPVASMAVAIAACDRPGPLLRCVDALLEGDLLPSEIIVVDQSRDDAIETVLATRAGERPPVCYIRQPRLGLSASRNKALAQTRHPLIAFTDDDCLPDQRWLSSLSRMLGENDGLAAVTGRVLPLGEERPGTFVVSARTGSAAVVFRGKSVPWTVGTGANFAARREWLLRVGGFDERLGAGSPGRAGEDAELLYRLLVAGATIRYIPEAVIYHERQGLAQRLATRRSYGHGIGALCALWVRRRDLFASKMLAGWLQLQLRGIMRAGVTQDWFMVRQRLLGVRGCMEGIAYGLKMADAAIVPPVIRLGTVQGSSPMISEAELGGDPPADASGSPTSKC